MYRVKYTLVRFNYHIVTFSDEGIDFRIEAACVCRTRREKSLLFPDLRRASSNEHHLSFFARTCSLSFFPVFFFLPSFLSLFLEAPSISRRGRYSSSLNPISYKLTSPSLSVHCPCVWLPFSIGQSNDRSNFCYNRSCRSSHCQSIILRVRILNLLHLYIVPFTDLSESFYNSNISSIILSLSIFSLFLSLSISISISLSHHDFTLSYVNYYLGERYETQKIKILLKKNNRNADLDTHVS